MKWCFRYTTKRARSDGKKKRSIFAICNVEALDEPDEARKIAATAKAALAAGQDPKVAARTALAKALALSSSTSGGESSVESWSFEKAREEFKKNPPKDLRSRSVDSYYRAISQSQVGAAIFTKRLVDITPDELENAQNEILSRGKERQAQTTRYALDRLFEWSCEPIQTKQSGLTKGANPMSRVPRLKSPKKAKPTKQDSVANAERIRLDEEGKLHLDSPDLMSMLDLGHLLIFLSSDTNGFGLLKRAIVMLILYTAARCETIASAINKALVFGRHQRMALWVLDGGTTKAGRMHVLPCSLVAWKLIEQWRAMRPNSVWLFPGLPTKRKPVADGHVHVRTVNEWFHEACSLAGCSVSHPPHRVRKAFNTYLSTLGVSPEKRKLILDHCEGRSGDVNEDFYNLDPMISEKCEAIAAWETFLEKCIELAKKPSQESAGSTLEIGRRLDRSDAEPAAAPVSLNGPSPHTALAEDDMEALRLLQQSLDERKDIDNNIDSVFGKRSRY